jgi:hypothetical protein
MPGANVHVLRILRDLKVDRVQGRVPMMRGDFFADFRLPIGTRILRAQPGRKNAAGRDQASRQ